MPVNGLTKSFGPLNAPDLVGVTVDFQALVTYFTTIGLTTEFGTSNGLAVTFL